MARQTEVRRRFLTDTIIAAFSIEPVEYMVWDTEQPYLGLRIMPNGDRSWYYVKTKRNPAGKSEHIKLKISSWPLMRADQARDVIARMDLAAKMGVHPKRFRQQIVWAACTVRDLFQEYLDKHLRVHGAEYTVADIEARWHRYMAPILDIPAKELNSLDVQNWVNELAAKHGKETANKQFRILKACLNFAHLHCLCEFKRMPTLGVKTFQSHQRIEYLKPEEYPAFNAALNSAENQDHADLIRLLLTGARYGNVKAMQWQHIDLHGRIWRISSSEAKARKEIAIPLTESALKILERRRKRIPEGCRWVFPAHSASGHIEDVTKTWNYVRRTAGLEHLVLHSLRHTVGSHLGMSGASSFVIQRALGHASSRTSEIYTHLHLDPVREELEEAHFRLTGERSSTKPLPPGVVKLQPRQLVPIAIESNNAHRSKTEAKNADVVISPAEQIIVEGKIITAIRQGGNNKKAFYRKIGAGFEINAREMDRILNDMIQRRIIERYRDQNSWHAWKYALVNDAVEAT